MFAFSISASGLLVFLFLAIYKFIVYPTFVSPLSKIPNAHWSAPISPLWILWIRRRCRENRKLHAAHLRLGPVIRLAPNELSVNDLASLRTVYAGGFEKGQWYSIFDNYGYVLGFYSWDLLVVAADSSLEFHACSPLGILRRTPFERE